MKDKIKIQQGKVFIYNENNKRFEDTTNTELIGCVILDIAEEKCNFDFNESITNRINALSNVVKVNSGFFGSESTLKKANSEIKRLIEV